MSFAVADKVYIFPHQLVEEDISEDQMEAIRGNEWNVLHVDPVRAVVSQKTSYPPYTISVKTEDLRPV